MFNGKLKAEIASLKAQLAEAQGKVARLNEENDRLAMRLADKSREARTVGAALNEVIAERDALREAAAAKRAKQLANLRNQPKLEQATH